MLRSIAAILILTCCLLVSPASANVAASFWCEVGAQVVLTSGLSSANMVQGSYPQCLVTVYPAGSSTPVPSNQIFSNNLPSPTILGNPFTADLNGWAQFYTSNGRYDIVLSGAVFPLPFTISDVSLFDPTTGTTALASGLAAGTYNYGSGPVIVNANTANTATSATSAVTATHALNLPADLATQSAAGPAAALFLGLQAASINGAYDATACSWGATAPAWCSGSDIGAWINAAATQLMTTSNWQNGGTIIVPAKISGRCWAQTTPVVFTTKINVWGQGTGATCIQYTPTSGTAFTYNTGGQAASGYGLHDLQLAGPGGGNTSIGVMIAGSGVLLERVEIGGFTSTNTKANFHRGVTYGNNSYLDIIRNSVIWQNDQNLYYPSGLTNSGELLVYDRTVFGNGGTYNNCVQFGTATVSNLGPEVKIYGSSFDDCQLTTQDTELSVFGGHFEALSAQSTPLVVVSGDKIYGNYWDFFPALFDGVMFAVDSTWTAVGMVEGINQATLIINNPIENVASQNPFVYLLMTGVGTPSLTINAPYNTRTPANLYSVSGGTPAYLQLNTAGMQTWQNASLGASWTQSGSNLTVGYFIDPNNVVHLRGCMNGIGPVTNATLFTLGSGYRPTGLIGESVFTINSGTGLIQPGAITIASNGTVAFTTASSGSSAVCIDGITFATY